MKIYIHKDKPGVRIISPNMVSIKEIENAEILEFIESNFNARFFRSNQLEIVNSLEKENKKLKKLCDMYKDELLYYYEYNF